MLIVFILIILLLQSIFNIYVYCDHTNYLLLQLIFNIYVNCDHTNYLILNVSNCN
jgi:hypothetical protein